MRYFWNSILLQAIELVRSVVYLVWIYSVLWGFQVVRLQGKEAKMLDRLAGYEFQLVPVHFRGRSFSYSSGLLIFRFLIFEFHRFEWKFFRFWSRLIILNKDFNDPTDHWQNGLNRVGSKMRFYRDSMRFYRLRNNQNQRKKLIFRIAWARMNISLIWKKNNIVQKYSDPTM